VIRHTGHFKLSLLLVAALLISGCGGPQKTGNMSARELYALAKDKYDHKKYYRAIELFQNLVYSHAGDPVVDTAQYYLGMSYFGNDEYQLASAEFNRLLINYPSSAFAEHAQFMRAAATFQSAPKHFGLDQSELKPALDQLQDFISDRPESPYLADAKALLLSGRSRIARKMYESAMVYFRVEAYSAANIYFQKVVDDYLDTEHAPRSLYMISEGEYKMKHFDLAREKFEGFAKVFPKHEWIEKARGRAADAAFNLGVTSFEARDFSKARERFENFKTGFPNDSRVKKADTYLAKLKDVPVEQQQTGKADS
jgi:outer membrane protein assembly factor BamD